MRRWRNLYRRRGEYYSVPPATPPGPQALTPGRLRRKRHWRPKRRGAFYQIRLVGQAPAVVERAPDAMDTRPRRWPRRRRGQFFQIALVGQAPVVVQKVPDGIVRRRRRGQPRRRGQFYSVRTAVVIPVTPVVPIRLTRRNRNVMFSRTRGNRFYRVPKVFLPLRDLTVEMAPPGVSWAADGPTARTVGGRLEKGVRAVRSPSVAWEVMSPTE